MSQILKKTIFLIGAILFLQCSQTYSGKPQPIPGPDGVLDISEWDFEKDGPITLKEGWEFYWDQLILEPTEETLQNWDNLSIPEREPKEGCGIQIGKQNHFTTDCKGYQVNSKAMEMVLNQKYTKIVTTPHAWNLDMDIGGKNYPITGRAIYVLRIRVNENLNEKVSIFGDNDIGRSSGRISLGNSEKIEFQQKIGNPIDQFKT